VRLGDGGGLSFLKEFRLFGIGASERRGWGFCGCGSRGSLAFVCLVDGKSSLGEKVLFGGRYGLSCEGCIVSGRVIRCDGWGQRVRRGVGVRLGRWGDVVELFLEVFGNVGASFVIWVLKLVVRYRGRWDTFFRFGQFFSQIFSFFVA